MLGAITLKHALLLFPKSLLMLLFLPRMFFLSRLLLIMVLHYISSKSCLIYAQI